MSVVVACHDHGQFLAECLASLRAQTILLWEALVVDDGSPNRQVLERAIDALDDPRIRLLGHAAHRGRAAALNTGFEAATAQWVLTVDPGDRLAPRALEELFGALDVAPELDVVYSDQRLFGRAAAVREFPGPPSNRPLLHLEHSLPGAGTLLRKALWKRLGGFDEGDVLRAGREELDFWIRAFEAGCAVERLAEPVYEKRVLHSSFRAAVRDEDAEITDYVYTKNRALFDKADQGALFRSAGSARAAHAAYQSGRRGEAFALAARAWRIQPSKKRFTEALRCLVSPARNRALDAGALRRAVPFLGYPLHGNEGHRPFFVIGAGRSGNTLLRRILTSHSELHVPPETFVLGRCIRLWQREGRRLLWPDLVSRIMAQFQFHPEFHLFEMDLAPLVERLSQAPREKRNLADVLDAFYRHHAATHGSQVLRWGDKTPMNSLDDASVRGDVPRTAARLGAGVPETLERLLHVFPDAQFVHICRDGCDVAYSTVQGGFYSSLEDAAKRWLHVELQTQRFAREHPECSLDIRYEDLVTRPDAVVGGLCHFLGVPFEPGMLSSEAASAKLGDIPAWFWHAQAAQPINAKNPGKARRLLSRGEKEALQEWIGAALEERGYPPATSRALEPDTPPAEAEPNT